MVMMRPLHNKHLHRSQRAGYGASLRAISAYPYALLNFLELTG